MLIVDSHCHLDYDGLAERLPDVLAAADAAGVGLMLTISTRVAHADKLFKIVKENTNVFCTIGTHPHNAHEELDVPVSKLVGLSMNLKCVGIGEAGLDYHYDKSPRAAQEEGFRKHIAVARITGLPLIIHSREADDDMARILTEEMAKGPFKMVLHCFTGGIELARAGLKLGAYVSFSGILTYKSAENLRVVAAEIPMGHLLVETDAPYLAPEPHRGKSNEPAFVSETLKQLADIKGVSVETMAQTTSDNFFRLFSKVTRPARFTAAA